MKLRVLAVFAISLTLAACASTTVAPVPSPPDTWETLAADDYTCKASEAVAADLAAVVAKPERFFDKCIRLRALLKHDFLLRDATAPGTGIVLYLKDRKLHDAMATHPQFVVVSGRLRACPERMKRIHAILARDVSAVAPSPSAPTGGAVNVITAYCSGVGGPALFAATLDPIPTAMD